MKQLFLFLSQTVIPRIHPACGHCVCEECLKTMIKGKKELLCPQCRVATTGKKVLLLSKFPRNWGLLQCLAAVKDAEEKDKADVFDVSKFGFESLQDSTLPSSTSFASTGCTTPVANNNSYWVCLKCTLHNTLTDSHCEMCASPRPKRRRANESKDTTAFPVGDDEDEDMATPTSATVDPDSFLERVARQYEMAP